MTNINQLPYLTTKRNNPMKKLLTTIILLTIIATLHAQAPELKNMMPNSWQKLTRLTVDEEKEFLEKVDIKKYYTFENLRNPFKHDETWGGRN